MTVSHHPDDATLLRYASGGLDEAFAVVVASHLAMCARCRKAAHDAEAIGGELLAEAGDAPLVPDAFARLLDRLDEPRAPAVPPPLPAEAGDVPLPLRRLVGPSLDAIAWKTVAPGVATHAIELGGAGRSALFMLNVAPGKSVPEHGHGGEEITLVLTGAYRDAFGRFGPGDVADLDERAEHHPRVEPGARCVCIIAAEAPARFKGIFSRLYQPFVGI